MATSTQNPDSALCTALGKLHPDYTIEIVNLPNEVYPYIIVTNGKKYINIQIRLARNYWDVRTIDRLVTKAIKRIEEPTIEFAPTNTSEDESHD